VRKVPLHKTDALGRTTLPQLRRRRQLLLTLNSRPLATRYTGSVTRLSGCTGCSISTMPKINAGYKDLPRVAKVQRAWEARALASVIRTLHAARCFPPEREKTTTLSVALSHAPTERFASQFYCSLPLFSSLFSSLSFFSSPSLFTWYSYSLSRSS